MKVWVIGVGIIILGVLAVYYFSDPWISQKLNGNTIPVKFTVTISKGLLADPNMETFKAEKVSSCGFGMPMSIVTGGVDTWVDVEVSGFSFPTNSVYIGDSGSSTVSVCKDIPPGQYPVVFELNWKQGSGSVNTEDRVSKTLTVSSSATGLNG